jgi:hypothetical protein
MFFSSTRETNLERAVSRSRSMHPPRATIATMFFVLASQAISSRAACFAFTFSKSLTRPNTWNHHRSKSSRASSVQSKSAENCLVLPSHPKISISNVMAPMVAASDYPFRYFLRKCHGVDLTYTQMLQAKNFVNDKTYRDCHLDLFETGTRYTKLLPSQLNCVEGLEGLPLPNETEHDDGPVMVQLAGHDVDLVVKAANIVYEHTGKGYISPKETSPTITTPIFLHA